MRNAFKLWCLTLLIAVVSAAEGCVSKIEPERPQLFKPEGVWDVYDVIGDFPPKPGHNALLLSEPKGTVFFEDGVMGEYNGYLNKYEYSFDEAAQRLIMRHIAESRADTFDYDFYTVDGFEDMFFYEYYKNGEVMTGCFTRNVEDSSGFHSDFDASGAWKLTETAYGSGAGAFIFNYTPGQVVTEEYEESPAQSYPYDYFNKILSIFGEDGEKRYYIDRLDGEYRAYFTELYWNGEDARFGEWGVFAPDGSLFDAAEYSVLTPLTPMP
jgi:hypothetical protein